MLILFYFSKMCKKLKTLSSPHKNINFTSQIKVKNSLPFLENKLEQIARCLLQFITRPHPAEFALILTLRHGAFKKLNNLKLIYRVNNYPISFTD